MPTLEVIASRPPAVFGHRGASAYAPDNSEAAFRIAHDQGAAGVELDVRRTGDDVLVIHHDEALAGHLPLVEMEYAAAKAAQPDLLTFDEAMSVCAGMVVNIEIKNSPADADHDPDDSIAPRVAAWVSQADAYLRTLVSSFNAATVAAVRAVDPAIPTGLLVAPPTDPALAIVAAVRAGHRAVHPYVDQIDAAVVAAAHDAGLWVLVWTVDDPDRIRDLAAVGVDGLITNDPATALAALG